MQRFLTFVAFATVALAGFPIRAETEIAAAGPAFRIRSDFAAGLNSDDGWAGRVNENVTIHADRPFRVRFESDVAQLTTDSREFRLQYRRNDGEWTDIEAQDFPHPDAEIKLEFDQLPVGSTPDQWSIAHGDAATLQVATTGRRKVLQARAAREPLIALYSQSPPATDFKSEARVRLPKGSTAEAGLVFGYVDHGNYGSVSLNPAAGTIVVRRFVNGMETVLATEQAVITTGEWHDLEIDVEGAELEVNFNDEAPEFVVEVGPLAPTSSLGFSVPAAEIVEFDEITVVSVPRTPRISIVACPAYENGARTTDLLQGVTSAFQPGVGLNLVDRTPSWTGSGHGEFEWPLVVRRFADGAVTNDEGDKFEVRMIAADGSVLHTAQNPVLRLAVPSGHVGGTFVETPGRIGPWQAASGDLYFIMEPTETDNVFMMIKSTDDGRTWSEVDGANRPRADDLESVDARLVGDTIHIIHQVTEAVWYHAFRTSDHPDLPDSWAVRDELAARTTAVAQAATVAVRSDGSQVAFYVGLTKIHYSIRSRSGVWSSQIIIDPDVGPNLAGPQCVLGANDKVHLAYYGTDGTIWYRTLLRDGTLTNRQQLSSGAGTTRAEYGAVLPLGFIPESNTVIIVYRLASGGLWEQRIVNDAPPTPRVRVTDHNVVRDAVDSQQPAADVVIDGSSVHVLYVEESSRSIFSTDDKGGWQAPIVRVENILGSWLRGTVYTRPDGMKVYGYIYDAGSDGGAGMNRFGEIPLNSPHKIERAPQ